MSRMSKIFGMTALTVMMGMGLPTFALSSSDRTVYDQPDGRTGKIIKGKVMDVLELKEKSAEKSGHPSWYVFVLDQETGELVL